MILRIFLRLFLLVFLVGCSTAESVWAPDAEVARAYYRHDGPPTLTLFTVISNTNESGAHSALLINGSQRIIFDPAGTWYHPRLPERNDVHFGMTDAAVEFYVDYHSRVTFRTVIQEVVVTPEVAELALRQALAYGAVPKAQCSKSITAILASLPGFESFRQTWYPKKLMDSFGKIPGVTTEIIYDDDPDKNTGFITAYGI
ncbi:MAG: hypothetical protein ACU0CA_02305 [Paracoccaceae bacterium]